MSATSAQIDGAAGCSRIELVGDVCDGHIAVAPAAADRVRLLEVKRPTKKAECKIAGRRNLDD